jgi:hypothetical protein
MSVGIRTLFIVCVCVVTLHAQLTTGSVMGTVTDSTGAMMPGVKVTLSNTGTGAAQTAATDTAGNFRFLLLPSGVYRLEAASSGFKTFRRDGIVVEVDRSIAVPVLLEVGQVTETVEVTAGTPLLEPNTSSLGTVMDQRKIEDLPLNGRNPMGLANLIPTVRGLGYFGGQVLSTWRMGQVTIAGGGPMANGFLVDGIASEKMTDFSAMSFLTVDSTQEFKVQTNAMSAEFGRTGGGIISMISKGGTNTFHGSLFEYLRNDKLNANEFFANKAGAARPTVKVNQFGGTLGGPVLKDKLFFFANYEGFRERRASSRTITSPTALERDGDFSQTRAANGTVIAIYDPLTTRADESRPGSYVRDQFPNNRIPSNRISAIARNALGYYPMPNLPGLPNSGAQNLFQQSSVPTDKDTWGVRLDYNLAASRRLSGRYTRDVLDWGFPNYFGNIADTDGRVIRIPRHSAFVQYTDALTPTLLLDAKIGVNRENEHSVAPGAGFDVASLGFPSSFTSSMQQGRLGNGFPVFTIADASSFGRPDSTGNPSTTGSASAAVTRITGKHTLKGGYEQRLYRRGDWGTSFASGNFSFTRGFTQGPNPLAASATAGYGVASFLLGTPSSGESGFTSDTTVSSNYYALFAQDDWKVTSKLTLNLGLRWEYEGPVKDRYNVFPNFDPTIESPLKVPGMTLRGGYSFPGTNGIPSGLTDQSWNDFGPRFGFAYQVNRRIVARGGYGLMYIPTFGPGGTSTGAGFAITTPMVTSIDGGLRPYNTLANPFPTGVQRPTGSAQGAMTGVGIGVAGQLRDVERGYSQQWNLTLQYEPWNNWLIETAWVANKGSRLIINGRQLNILTDQQLSLGSALLQTVPNPFAGVIQTGALAASTVTARQLMLPYPQFTSVSGGSAYLGNSIYHAFTLKVEKRFSKGFSLLAGYTASKLIDDLQATGRPGAVAGTTIQNWTNLAAERSKSYQDLPQRLVLTGLWELPYRSANRIVQGVLGGWQLNSMATIESGRPISLAATIPNGGNRPNVVPGVEAKLDNPTLEKWFNTAAFSQPAAFTYGNASRTLPDVHSDGMFSLDSSIFKNFAVRENVRLQFRAEAFNVTNTPTFDTPGRSLNAATFGVVTATAFTPRPRECQFALRLSF